MSNIAVRVTPDALRQVRHGSPWVYDGSITSASREGTPGELAVIFDSDRKFAALGLWDPTSPIRVKVLHRGKPVTVDGAFWRTRLTTALDRRSGLASDGDTTAYRLVHGENDGLPGLVADRYDATIVVKLYTGAWFPHLDAVVAELVALTGATRVVLRLARSVETTTSDGSVLVGPPVDGPVVFRERGIEFEADVVAGQKTGHFLDQRDNRSLVRGMADGRDVLDVFASTGGFALSAAAGGARRVHLVDLAAPALDTARSNLARNRHLIGRTDVRFTVGDAFEVLAALAASGERFGLVIVDPPSFAQNQTAVDRAIRAYTRLTHLALGVLEPGGTLVQCSCSSRVTADQFFDAVHAASRSAKRPLTELRRTGHAVDHPIGFEHGAYLKAIYATAR
ncbi:MAG TPA: class I SAM-dependent rRNA methyltransferase [Ilumatobacter sp.]|nr:class I SAM-dependent rRNA methyltransferase [Ilumatobacter sp.]